VRARTTALLVTAVAGLLVLYMLVRAVDLLRTGSAAGVLLGIGVLLLVVLGAVLLVGELRFGAATERLGRRLSDEGGLPSLADDVPRLPSGRLTRDAADALFADRKAEVEAEPGDWRAWYRLAAAYGEARDTARGRRAMRTALRLEREERPGR
jgi:hypothetical protein